MIWLVNDKFGLTVLLVVSLAGASFAGNETATPVFSPTKNANTLYPASMIEKAKANAAKFPWAAAMQKQLVDSAAPWLKMSDDDLWNLPFGANIDRSWMVR